MVKRSPSHELLSRVTLGHAEHGQRFEKGFGCAADAEEGGSDRGEGVLSVSYADIQQDVGSIPQWCPGLLQMLPERRSWHLPSVRAGFQDIGVKMFKIVSTYTVH